MAVETLKDLFGLITLIISIIAGVIVIWATVISLWKLFVLELEYILGESTNIHSSLNSIRESFGHRIAIALEFFLAADLLSLIFSPTTEDLYRIGAIVVIRIAINYFLDNEIDNMSRSSKKIAKK